MRCVNKYRKEAETICKHFIGNYNEAFVQSLNKGYFGDFVAEAIQISLHAKKVSKSSDLAAYFHDIELTNNITDDEAQASGDHLVVTDDLILIPTGNIMSAKLGFIGDTSARYWVNSDIVAPNDEVALELLNMIHGKVTKVGPIYHIQHENNAESTISVINKPKEILISKIKC